MAVHGGPCGMPGIQPRSAVYKASVCSATLSLLPAPETFVMFSLGKQFQPSCPHMLRGNKGRCKECGERQPYAGKSRPQYTVHVRSGRAPGGHLPRAPRGLGFEAVGSLSTVRTCGPQERLQGSWCRGGGSESGGASPGEQRVPGTRGAGCEIRQVPAWPARPGPWGRGHRPVTGASRPRTRPLIGRRGTAALLIG